MKNTANIINFTKVENSTIEQLIKDCGLSTSMVYIMIKRHKISRDAHCCYPSNKALSIECDCSIRNIQKHITKLVEMGWLIVDSGGEDKNSNYYFPKEEFYKNEGSGISRRTNLPPKQKERLK